ncbi:hypothetical protein GQX73_g8698 [Xylaria multiplex]|uniref:Uncharacterized protein n=1 Tax=Xylaria multiplex TaxID=323545 RepID=A0A7C8IJ38_9PEZI|nr:hypothetical protein GQX73_g8698 [Xylaria multiplex]
MVQYLPLDRISFASLEDEQFFSAYSSQPASRLMSVFSTPYEQGQLPDDRELQCRKDLAALQTNYDVNSTVGPLEPLVPVCPPPTGTAPWSGREQESVLTPSANPHKCFTSHHHFYQTAIRHQVNHTRSQEPIQLEAGSPDESTSTTDLNVTIDKLPSPPTPVITTRRGSSVADIKQNPASRHFEGRSPTIARAQLDDYISKQGMDGIICNVRAFLSARRQNDNSREAAMTVINENDMPPSSVPTQSDGLYPNLRVSQEDQYLITTDNIADILDIVIASIRSIQDDGTQQDCRSLLFSSSKYMKPTLRIQNIIPGVSAAADPATTICSPQPCFSLANGLDKSGRPCPMPKTTYISRQSITEID